MSDLFSINADLLMALDEYDKKTLLMERHKIEKVPFDGDFESTIDDDLIHNVPIYDMGRRRYAAFCSLTEAVWRGDEDVKGNGEWFKDIGKDLRDIDWFVLLYLFRLCGSGINYVPKSYAMFDDYPNFLGTHGFGNFWIVERLLLGEHRYEDWLKALEKHDKPFSDNRGYMLPQFSMTLKGYILHEAVNIATSIYKFCYNTKREIYEITDFGNSLLLDKGFNRQNFVLTAFAADLAEYFPDAVDPKSRVYAGTQATRCIKAIFPKKGRGSEFDYINEVLAFQSERYGLNPIDCEDSRNCDMVRYLKEHQSTHHIKNNNGEVMFNNSVLKKICGLEDYYELAKKL